MTEPVSDDDLPAEDVYDPTGLELASEIAHQTARTSPLLPEVPALPPKSRNAGAGPGSNDPAPTPTTATRSRSAASWTPSQKDVAGTARSPWPPCCATGPGSSAP